MESSVNFQKLLFDNETLPSPTKMSLIDSKVNLRWWWGLLVHVANRCCFKWFSVGNYLHPGNKHFLLFSKKKNLLRAIYSW